MSDKPVNLKQFDDKIKNLESKLRQVENDRREFINRNNLNKPPIAPYTKG